MYLSNMRRLIFLCNHLRKIKHFPERPCRNFHLTRRTCNENKQLVVHGSFEDVQDKTKSTYLDMIHIFINRDDVYRRGHVEFVYAALKNMEAFNVHRDLEVYKAIINVLPKGKFIAQNLLQVEFMHYPKQQQCIIDVLEQMEDNGVMPDYEMEDLLANIFGRKSFPMRKYWRMMYWMPKFKNLTPWPIPDDLSDDVFDLTQCAIERITSVDLQTKVCVYQSKDIEDAINDTWIVSAQSPTQKRLIKEHDAKEPVYVEGGFRVWIKRKPVNYFILRAKPKELPETNEDVDDVSNLKIPLFNLRPPVQKQLKVVPSVHEQDDGTILAVCGTGTSSKDSLLSWIRHLERDGNPNMANLSIVFTLRSATERDLVSVNNVDNNSKEKLIDENG